MRDCSSFCVYVNLTSTLNVCCTLNCSCLVWYNWLFDKYSQFIDYVYVTEQIPGCLLEDGEVIKFGETFQKDGDICTTCTCMEGSILRCQSVGCVMPPRSARTCPEGQTYRMSLTKCCEFDCFSLTEDSEEGM